MAITDNKIISEAHKKVIHIMVDFFEQQHIRYQFTGGLAGNLYGSVWQLQDIDIEVNLQNLYTIEEHFNPFVVKGIHRYNDEEFDIWLLQLAIQNISIDINAVEDFVIKPDFKIHTDLDHALNILLEERPVKVQPLPDIIAYKQLLGRQQDLEDLNRLILTQPIQ